MAPFSRTPLLVAAALLLAHAPHPARGFLGGLGVTQECPTDATVEGFECGFAPIETLTLAWNPATPDAEGKYVTSMYASTASSAWVSVAWSETGAMVPALAAVGVAGSEPALHALKAKSTNAILGAVVAPDTPPPSYAPAISNIAFVQNNGTSTLTFTATSEGAIPEKVIFAHGTSDSFGYHGFFNRGSATINFNATATKADP